MLYFYVIIGPRARAWRSDGSETSLIIQDFRLGFSSATWRVSWRYPMVREEATGTYARWEFTAASGGVEISS